MGWFELEGLGTNFIFHWISSLTCGCLVSLAYVTVGCLSSWLSKLSAEIDSMCLSGGWLTADFIAMKTDSYLHTNATGCELSKGSACIGECALPC